MKILFVTNDLYPYLNANSDIVYKIARELVTHHHCSLSIIGFNRTKDVVFQKPDFPVEELRIKSVTDYFRITINNQGNPIMRILKYSVHPKTFMYYIRRKMRDEFSLEKEYQDEIKRVAKNERFDAIVGFMVPNDTLIAIARLNLNIPFIAYKLDPWSTHYQNIGNIKERELEIEVDKKASRIIVTNLIKADYETYSSEDILRKLIILEFPNIIRAESKERVEAFHDDKIHCVFSGGFYREIRSPQYTLELFKKLQCDNENILFHIIGHDFGDNVFPEILPPNVICHGRMSSEEAMKYMQSADILVNVGNTVLNQMPSKILTYISLGKPILNIVKSPRCPTLPYTEKYPLALNVIETPEVKQEDVDRVKDFIFTSRGKQLPFEEIKEKYYTCTPEFIGKQLYDVICEVIKEKKNKE